MFSGPGPWWGFLEVNADGNRWGPGLVFFEKKHIFHWKTWGEKRMLTFSLGHGLFQG